MKRRLLSRRALAASCLGFLALPWSCTQAKPRGELMIAISADMSIPKNMNQVYLEVLDESGHKNFGTYALQPESLGEPMPGSLAIVPPDGGGQRVRLRLRAEHDNSDGKDATVRVVREAVVTIPKGRVAMLTMPIRWLCDGMVSKAADGTITSGCGDGQTCAAGICVKATFNGDDLPDYDPAKVFGGGDADGNGGQCMDVIQCFANGTDVVPDAGCIVPAPPGVAASALNVAMVTGNDGDGICPPTADGSTGTGNEMTGTRAPSADASVGIGGSDTTGPKPQGGATPVPNGAGGASSGGIAGAPASSGTSSPQANCYVPLDSDPQEGWHLVSGGIQLPQGVCDRLSAGKIRGVRVTTSCKAKDLTVPICGAWSNVTVKSPPPGGKGTGIGGTSGHTDGGVGFGGMGIGNPGGFPGAFRDAGATCSPIGEQAAPTETDLYLLVDHTMAVDPAAWSGIQQGIANFVALPTTGPVLTALQLLGDSCTDPALTVPLMPSSGSVPLFQSALAKPQTQSSSLDFGFALSNALNLDAQKGASSPHATAFVLMTTGTPGTCQSQVDPVSIARTALSHGASTYVFSLPGTAAQDPTPLTAIALAAGTNLTDVTAANAAQQITDGLTNVRDSLAGCSFITPPALTGVTLVGSTSTVLKEVPPTGCVDGGGYYRNPAGNVFTLCPSSCATLNAPDRPRVMLSAAGCGAGGGGTTGIGGFAGGGGVPSGVLPCSTTTDCPQGPNAPCCVAGRCGFIDQVSAACVPSGTGVGGAGGTAGAGGFGGAGNLSGMGGAPPSKCAGVGAAGQPTDADCMACMQNVKSACSNCECLNCLAPVVACMNDAGCAAIKNCADTNGCSSSAACSAGTCAPQIQAAGGPTGSSATLFDDIAICGGSGTCLGPCPPAP